MIEKYLGFDKKSMTIRTELIAGLTTFLTMSYILAVNPSILGTTGMDKGAVFTATALASAIATLLLAFMAKLPFAQAPSMALNAFFAFTLVEGMGYSWQTALTAMFVEGVIFILITFINIREIILNSIPMNLRYAISAGIGMFIAFIGLKNAGIIASNPSTFVQLGEFTPASVLAMIGIIISGALMIKKVKGALFFSIIICTLIGIPLGVTQIPDNFLPVSMPHSLEPTFWKFDFKEFFTFDMAVIIFTLLFMNIFDTAGTLVGLATKTGIMKEDGEIPRVKEAMMSDAIGTTVGAVLGCSTITTYVESASGIAEGGRSGLTSFATGILFLIALFFAPIFLLIPGAATTGALVLVGVLMMDSIKKIDMDDISEALPAFVTIIMMVLTYSIADGMILGLLCFVLVKLLSGKYKEISIPMYILAILFILNYIFI
ncbi:AGZA family xanthine/uracil permease-like MFS transporter [Parabacteroides sp. PF5-5]|uniref:NCS2 family permease n=2 Tax=Parabacteroides TaxID=375288 RepID=UPI00247401AC|nr:MULTISPECIES: NCS2 family permease [unclassified Parabacteroides]MDH6316311.1 AGZA family xanthine/uracil permease-like MFS transporter [Parabacteroides sp. PF5-13]MDH6319794.1 AGZA family xanthine/uracil permease-like MFS transporter [Parabacteroides sp. PH5-13]MDH6323615.1 AGZA family xanthine/uracil permease-like MFS transporter [Parabacteroides sp. PH5-8]MDH6327498.1 AGZA family xanthine/uracil permease-like MFS transporter [Parabacteroides sp. PH5-41]MDH6335362.1 AGZA family xanthine/u